MAEIFVAATSTISVGLIAKIAALRINFPQAIAIDLKDGDTSARRTGISEYISFLEKA